MPGCCCCGSPDAVPGTGAQAAATGCKAGEFRNGSHPGAVRRNCNSAIPGAFHFKTPNLLAGLGVPPTNGFPGSNECLPIRQENRGPYQSRLKLAGFLPSVGIPQPHFAAPIARGKASPGWGKCHADYRGVLPSCGDCPHLLARGDIPGLDFGTSNQCLPVPGKGKRPNNGTAADWISGPVINVFPSPERANVLITEPRRVPAYAESCPWQRPKCRLPCSHRSSLTSFRPE